MKYRYPKSIDTPEGRKVYRRLARKIKRQATELANARETLWKEIQDKQDLKNVIAAKDKYIRRIRVAVNHKPA